MGARGHSDTDRTDRLRRSEADGCAAIREIRISLNGEVLMITIRDPQPGDLYVSPQGKDAWSGRLPEPDASGSDGPLATVARARDLIRARLRYGALPGPLTVWLRGGRYPLAEPLCFGPEDAAPVTYAAYPGETPILDGGLPIIGWREAEINGQRALAAPAPEALGDFRQLFVGGERRPRTRLPAEGYYWMADVPGTRLDSGIFDVSADRFTCAPGDIQPWRNLTDVEVVAPHFWICERMPLASFDPATNLLTSTRRSRFSLRDDSGRAYCRYWVENVREALLQPGQWYLDRAEGLVYYLPLPGEEADSLAAYAPRLAQLLRVVGDPESGRLVRFLRFVGLTWEHTTCEQPDGRLSSDPAGAPYASGVQAAATVPGALYLEGAEHCAIQGCAAQHLGGYVVEIGAGCSGVSVVGSHLWDLGGGGVKLGGSDAAGPLCRRTGNCAITDNHIHAGGRVHQAAVGLLATHAFNNDLSHNHIHDLHYSGISCGWVWGYAESVSQNNRIEKNHIHDLGHGLLSDMGGIYTLGVQPGTVLRGNLIHDIRKWHYGGWAIYPDEGSAHLTIENNVCYDTNAQVFHQHYGRENIVRNNIWAFGEEGIARHSRIGGNPGDLLVPREAGRLAFTFERNILVSAGRPFFLGGRGAPLGRRNFASDLNLYWDTTGAEFLAGDATQDAQGRVHVVTPYPLAAWRALGQDRHSLVADPGFVDLAARDFTLPPGSPALELGFQPIDLSDVGPRAS